MNQPARSQARSAARLAAVQALYQQHMEGTALARLLDTEPVAACMLSSSFSNPLGSLMPEAQKRELLALLAPQTGCAARAQE